MQKVRATPTCSAKLRQSGKLHTKSGIVHLLILGLILIIGLALIGGWMIAKKTKISPTEETPKVFEIESNTAPLPVTTPFPTSTPKSTTTLTKTVVKPTSAPVAEFKDPCGKYKDTPLAYVKVIMISSTGSLNETAKIVVKPGAACPAGLPTGYTSQVEYTMRPEDSMTWMSPGFTLGDIRVNIDYKGNGYGYDVEGTSGVHEVTVNLKN